MTAFSFSERMIGTYRRADDGGRELPMEFRITATSRGRPRLLKNVLDLTGTMHAADLADGTPLSGTLTIKPIGRTLTYDVTFDGDDGGRYRLTGTKNVKLLSPVQTMTNLPSTLFLGGREVGTAHLRFLLRKDFLSWLTSIRRAPA